MTTIKGKPNTDGDGDDNDNDNDDCDNKNDRNKYSINKSSFLSVHVFCIVDEF